MSLYKVNSWKYGISIFFIISNTFQTEKGIRDVLRCDALFANKRPIHRAFHLAKKVGPKGKSGKGDDYLEKREFRLFLQLLRQYFEYMQAFSR